MIMSTMSHRAVRGSDRKASHVEFVPGAVPELRSLVDNLVESRENIVRELDLSDGGRPDGGHADGEPDDALLTERGVEDSVLSKLLLKVHGGTEDTAETYVLSEDACVVVCFERDAHAVA